MPLPRGGTKEAGGGRSKSGRLLVFFDIHARFVDGFDHNAAFGFRLIALACLEDVIAGLASAGDPNEAILALDRLSLAVIQVQHLARAQEQFDSWGL